MTKPYVLGVDACKGGWVGIELRDGAFTGAHFATGLDDMLAALSDLDAVGLDMPLGLPSRGWRQADLAAARALEALRSTVFRVPPRAVWNEVEYEAAVRRCQELNGRGFSRQAWGLREKLLQANACWETGAHQLYEVHPEISFWAVSRGRRLHSKKTWAGHMERRRLLYTIGVLPPDDLGDAGRAAPDDVLDAAAAAWSADRIARNEARSFPDPAEKHESGRLVAIWY